MQSYALKTVYIHLLYRTIYIESPTPPFKKKQNKKQTKTPTYPILKFHVIGNTHIFFFGLREVYVRMHLHALSFRAKHIKDSMFIEDLVRRI